MCDDDYGAPELVFPSEVVVGDLIARKLPGRSMEWHRVVVFTQSSNPFASSRMFLVVELTGEHPRADWVDRSLTKRTRVRRRIIPAST